MVLLLLAELDKEQALAEGYLLLFGIALAGLIGVLAMLGLFLLRRYTRRRLAAIELDREERRKASSVARVDAWSAGADRYVDQDKLPDDLPYDTPPEPDDADDDDTDDDPDQDTPPPGWDDAPPDDEQDPYGLFDDKPYREADDDEDEDDGDEDEGDGRR